METKVKINKHSSIKIDDIYIDPYLIEEEKHDAKYIFITHSHYDHYSPEDISKVANEKTVFICPEDVRALLLDAGVNDSLIIPVRPLGKYEVNGLKFSATYAYNKNHPKEKEWVGYVISYEGLTYYISGDTDFLEENLGLDVDVALVPVGGTYTMDYRKAAEFINLIRPHKAIPMHYGVIVGSKNLGKLFLKEVDSDIEVELINCF